MRIFAAITVCLILLCAALVARREIPKQQELVEEAARALRLHRLQHANDTIQTGLQHYPDDGKLLLLEAELKMLDKNWEAALEILGRIPSSDVESYKFAKFTTGEIHRNNDQLLLAEAAYQDSLSVSPDMMVAHERLASMKRWTGRPMAARFHLQKLLQGGQASPEHLVWLAAPGHLVQAELQLTKAHAAVPGDPLANYGLGSLAMLHGNLQQAIELFERGLSSRFDPEVYAALGQCLVMSGDFTKLDGWRERIPTEHLNHPEVNYIAGLIHETNRQSSDAISSFAACLRKEPNHKKALSHLAMNLNATEKDRRGATVLEVLRLVSQLAELISRIEPEKPSPTDASLCSQILDRLGRRDEADWWSNIAGRSRTENRIDQSDAVAELNNILVDIESKRPQAFQSTSSFGNDTQLSDKAKFRFRDTAAKQGIDFQYFESPDENTEGRRMFEFTGGGVGVLDIEMDGLPDLYFTQGAEWPVSQKPGSHVDGLFRQVDGHFERIDAVANIVEAGFGQGISIADVNNDGFNDIYIANIGPNTLLFSNGDGTFHSATSATPEDSAWTTSCVIADLNSDGHADIYDVNYVAGPEWDSKICPGPAGPRVCSPLSFSPAMDRLCIGTGSGELVDQSEAFGIQKPANGLGIVVANLDTDAEPEIFVANDMMNNILWDRCPREGKQVFDDVSTPQGWAFNSDGTPQACMGVAAADLNGDQHIDLFVTNYVNETNALYINDTHGIAQELSSSFRLQGPSLPMLGFGTQAIDADLDGDWDLFVTNGDLDDFSHHNRPLRMPPQFFENLNNQRFAQVQAPDHGDYLSGEFRGRGLAKLDWNRDGLFDLAISHLDSPAALVTNLGKPQLPFFRLRLIGTASHRNAAGTTVTLITPTVQTSQQLTVGDGYQASNEQQLVFPIAVQDDATIEVYWPSGHIDHWTGMTAGNEYVGVEGRLPYKTHR